MRWAILCALVALAALPGAAGANDYTVTTGSDAGTGGCDVVSCSLREAIDTANLNINPDEIDFAGALTITPATALPALSTDTVINGTTGTGCTGTREDVSIDGNGASFDGLVLGPGSDGSRICSLNIQSFADGLEINSSVNTIDDNRIGTGLAGQNSGPNTTNSSDGIDLLVGGDDNTITGNTISGNTIAGIRVSNTSTGNDITGNMIGTGVAGEAAVPNQVGVILNGGSTLGGATDADMNVISGNSGSGVDVINGTVAGNHIGTDGDGEEAVPNGINGVIVDGPLAVVGGDIEAERNLISGNTGPGVFMVQPGVVRGNWIGPTQSGGPLSGQSDAIVVDLSGAGSITDNVIAGHGHYGVEVVGAVTGLRISRNQIGVMPDGTTVAAADTGIDLDDATTSTTIEDNTIAGNGGAGIEVAGTGTDIVGNTIGRDATGAATDDAENDEAIDVIVPADDTTITGNRLSNSNDFGSVQIWSGVATLEGNVIDANERSGVSVRDAATVRIGGSSEASSNEISGNANDGVEVTATAALVEVGRSSIHDNGTALDHLGIDLGPSGVTGEDTTDGIQDFPVLTTAAKRSSDTDVAGSVLAIVGHDVRIDVYSSPACDASGNGEGATWLGSLQLTANGLTSFEGTVDGASAPGQQVTATATDLDTGTTSEFSECFTATEKAEDPVPEPEPDPGQPPTGDQPTPPGIVTPPPLVVVPPAPKFPAKLAVLRNGVDDGVLDMLIQVTSRSVTPGAVLELDYNSSGKHTRFTVPITSTQIKVRKKLPKSQPKDTGIVEIEYDGNDIVNPDSVRLRAADGKSKLVRSKSSVTSGKLGVEGTINRDARGVVRLRLEFDRPDGTTGTLFWNVKIAGGKWKLSETLPAEAARGGQLSIQFTGYEKENLRGEQAAKQVLA